MSLLMDALRRAEQERPAEAGDRTAIPAPAAEALGLEPRPEQEAPAAEPGPAVADTAPQAATDPEQAARTETEPEPAPARLRVPATPWRAYAGVLAASLAAVALYYAWLARQTPAGGPTAVASAPVAVPEGPEAPPRNVEPAPVTAPARAAQTPKAPTQAAPTPAPRASAPASPARQAAPPEKTSAPRKPARRRAAPIHVERGQRTPPFAATLAGAYQAYQAGDWSRAAALYREVLQRFPRNRDALLGLAACALRQGDTQAAAGHYRHLLRLNPRDPVARAAFVSLAASGDPQALESRLRHWLDEDPDNALLHFTLGNLLSGQGRWREAQGAYFEALRHDPSRADYAYNLAVSLDHLGQTAQALRHYRRALEHAGRTPAFDVAAARRRAAQLQQQLDAPS